MTIRFSCLAVVTLTLLAAPVAAEEAAKTASTVPQTDIEIMRAKANSVPRLGAEFEQLVQLNQNPNFNNLDYLREVLFRRMNGGDTSLQEPVRISTLASLEPARSRAQAAEQVLSADLDGNWQITRDEIGESLKYGIAEGAAQAFLLADANQDNVLSTDEIKVAVATMANVRSGGRSQMPSMMVVFDFNDDDYLSQDEFARGAKALMDR